MSLDAIVVVPAGVVPRSGGGWRSTTYEESDASGTLGGRDRILAAALLAKRYPEASVVNLARTKVEGYPDATKIYADELCSLGVERERIVSTAEGLHTTRAGLEVALELARDRGWRRLVFVSSGFHIPRIRALFFDAKSDLEADFVESETILVRHDPTFAEYFEKLQMTTAYQNRLAAEARGAEAIKNGTHQHARLEDKRERMR